MKPMGDKIKAVKDFPQPKDVTNLRQFLGLTGYYRTFIADYATIALPLTHLLNKGVVFDWKEAQQAAFERLKQSLMTKPVLLLPDGEKPFFLLTDASADSCGAILEQEGDDKKRHPVAYLSKTFNKSQRNYTVTEKECLAIVLAIDEYRLLLYGRTFTIITDHSALKWLLQLKTPSGRLARWALKLQEYTFEVQHRPGTQMRAPDALSRNAICSLNVPTEKLDWSPKALLQAQLEDSDLKPIILYLKDPQIEAEIPLPPSGCALDQFFLAEDDLLYHLPEKKSHRAELTPQFCVPRKFIPTLLQNTHDSVVGGHLGLTKTYEKVHFNYFWKNMYKDVMDYVRSCDVCQRHKQKRPFKENLQRFTPVNRPWELLGLDICGPFPETLEGHKYLLVAVDYLTRWPEAFPLKSISAKAVAQAFTEGIICRYGTPESILTDLGTSFTAKMFQEVCAFLRIDQLHSIAYQHSTNGVVERMQQTIQNVIGTYVERTGRDWSSFVQTTLLALRTAVHAGTNATSFYLLYGYDCRLPYQAILTQNRVYYSADDDYAQDVAMKLRIAYHVVKQHLAKAAETREDIRTRTAKPQNLQPGDVVYWRCPARTPGTPDAFRDAFTGPWRIVEQTGPVNYVIQRIYGTQKKTRTVHHDQLRKGVLRLPFPEPRKRERDENITPALHIPHARAPQPQLLRPKNRKSMRQSLPKPSAYDDDDEDFVPNFLVPSTTELPTTANTQTGRKLRSQGRATDHPWVLSKPLERKKPDLQTPHEQDRDDEEIEFANETHYPPPRPIPITQTHAPPLIATSDNTIEQTDTAYQPRDEIGDDNLLDRIFKALSTYRLQQPLS